MWLWWNVGGRCIPYNTDWSKEGCYHYRLKQGDIFATDWRRGGPRHSSRENMFTVVFNISCTRMNAWLGICKQFLIVFKSPHPKLLFNGAGVGLRVQAVHVVVDGAELTGRNSGVATETRLQDGIMDEDILLLQKKTASSLQIYQTSRPHDNQQNMIFFLLKAEMHEWVFHCILARIIQWPLPDLPMIILYPGGSFCD